MATTPEDVVSALSVRGGAVAVLCSPAPCTGLTRAVNRNHLADDVRNSLAGRSALFVAALRPQVFLMENARELIRGNFSHHFLDLETQLRHLGYDVSATVHVLSRFGLPQQRERAIVVAVR